MYIRILFFFCFVRLFCLHTFRYMPFLFVILRKLRCQRNTIHLNLFLSFILRSILCFIKDEHVLPEGESEALDEIMKQMTSSQEVTCFITHSFPILFSLTLIRYFIENRAFLSWKEIDSYPSSTSGPCSQVLIEPAFLFSL